MTDSNHPVNPSDFNGLPQPRRLIAMSAIAFGSLVLMIDSTIATIALPTIANKLNIDAEQSVVLVTVYQLILAVGLMPLAAVGERIGLRRIYGIGLLLHCLGAAACFQAESLNGLLAARSLQALGTAASLSVGFGLIRYTFPAQTLGQGMAINTMASAFGTAISPVVGGWILSNFEWQWVFAGAVPFALVSLFLNRFLPETPARKQAFDSGGALLAGGLFLLLVLGLELWVDQPAAPLLPVVMLSAAAVFTVALVRHERRQANPVIPVELFARRDLSLAVVANLCMVLASILLMLIVPFRLQYGAGFEPASIGKVLAAYAFGSMMFAPLAGYLSDRLPITRLCIIGVVVSLLGLFWLIQLGDNSALWLVALALWICGAGFGIFLSPSARLIVGAAPPERAAATGSMVTTVRMLGQAIGASIAAGLLAIKLAGMNAMWVSVGLSCLAGVLIVFQYLAARKDKKYEQ